MNKIQLRCHQNCIEQTNKQTRSIVESSPPLTLGAANIFGMQNYTRNRLYIWFSKMIAY